MHGSMAHGVAQNVRVGSLHLPGELQVPDAALGLVVFVHGSGSSRRSTRNQFVARVLRSFGLGTLLFDLLHEEEALDATHVFDIELLGQRVLDALAWLEGCDDLAAHPVGLFGASTGAAAALRAAARLPQRVAAVVSRGGRPDLAGSALSAVRAPTLLIVGAEDPQVLALNQRAMRAMTCLRKLEIVPNAGHLFEEPGTLDVVASLAGHWFEQQFSRL